MIKQLKERFGKYLKGHQIKLLKYLVRCQYYEKNGNIYFQIFLYETNFIIFLNHLTRPQCLTLLRNFREHGRKKAAYIEDMKRNKHAYPPTEGWHEQCPCECAK